MAGVDNLKPFAKGADPRRGSKPKGAVHLSTHIQNLLNDDEFETLLADPREGWKTYKGAPVKAILRALAIKAIAGDVKAFDALAKYGYGTKLDVTSNGKDVVSPVLVKFVGEHDERADDRDTGRV